MRDTAPLPVLFAGPSLVEVDGSALTRAEVEFHPPVRRGDVERLVVAREDPGTLIIADGVFHHYPSVGHAEIRFALGRGWEVWGVSSMGAIRAAEMLGFGMRGFGLVFERFASDPDFCDDEVALLHWAEPPFTPLTEPLIHIRAFLGTLLEDGRIDQPQADVVLSHLKSLWFGYRTLAVLARLLESRTRMSSSEILAETKSFRKYRVKIHDIQALLERRPWLR
jgi:hypothetical protein